MESRTKRQAEAREKALVALVALCAKLVRGAPVIVPDDVEAVVDALIEAATPQPSDHAAAVGELLKPLKAGEIDHGRD
jgi:hypothetical protein